MFTNSTKLDNKLGVKLGKNIDLQRRLKDLFKE